MENDPPPPSEVAATQEPPQSRSTQSRGSQRRSTDGGSLVKAAVDSSSLPPHSGGALPLDEWEYDFSRVYRWAITGIYLVITFFAGPSFMNWPPFNDMFNWANANAHLCLPTDPSFAILDHGEIACDEKQRVNENISGTTASVMFVFDLCGGVMLDFFGAKITALFGLLLQFLGWLMWVLSSPDGFHGWTAGAVLQAAGADPVYFGLISYSNLFPGWSSTAMSALGTLRSLSFANGLILRAIWSGNRDGVTLRKLAIGFMCIHAALILTVALVTPWKPYPKMNRLVRKADYESAQVNDSSRLRSYKKHVKSLPALRQRDRSIGSRFKGEVKQLWKYMVTLPYAIIICIAIIQLVRNSYYGNTWRYHLPDVKDFYEISLPLSVIPCPFLGILADRWSSAMALALTVASAAISMLFALFKGGKAVQCISVVFNWVFQSFEASEFYVYLAYIYPLEVYGRLAGVALLVGGLFGLVGGVMNDHGVATGQYIGMDVGVVVLGAAAFLAALYLHWWVERPFRKSKKQAALTASASNSAAV